MADEKDKKEPWLNYLALSTVILAVCATLSTFKGGGYSTRSVMSQSQASDQWAFFQAKSVKLNLYELQKEKLQMELAGHSMPKAEAEAYLKAIEGYQHKIEKYEKEKEDIKLAAKQLEETRDEAQKHSKTFGIAVIFLQIAILLSSIAGLLKKKPVWVAGLAIGALGLVYFADGFLMFLNK